MSKNNCGYRCDGRKGVRRVLWMGLIITTAFLASCGPVTPSQQSNDDFSPFAVRDGGKSKIVYAPPEIFLEDQHATVVCTGRPTMVRILSVPDRRVLAKIPVEDAMPMADGWHASFPLFEGLSAFFKPGETFLVACWGVNGTDGSTMPVTAYYTHAQLLNTETE